MFISNIVNKKINRYEEKLSLGLTIIGYKYLLHLWLNWKKYIEYRILGINNNNFYYGKTPFTNSIKYLIYYTKTS